jgi:iron-sulfur cluster repair protein YtfE (RIC family)
MDVTKILEQDHRDAETLFAQILKADGAERQSLIDELNTALRAHMELEERVLYPAIEPVTGTNEVQEANQEHQLARQGLDSMLELAPDEPGFDGALESVKAGILHHVEEEENELFPQVRKDGSAILDQIATPFMKLRVELGMPMEADALSAASSKDELVSEAKAAEVEGADSMTKAELADALVGKLSS